MTRPVPDKDGDIVGEMEAICPFCGERTPWTDIPIDDTVASLGEGGTWIECGACEKVFFIVGAICYLSTTDEPEKETENERGAH